MTIPQLHNCAHRGDGWCLDCVRRFLWDIPNSELPPRAYAFKVGPETVTPDTIRKRCKNAINNIAVGHYLGAALNECDRLNDLCLRLMRESLVEHDHTCSVIEALRRVEHAMRTDLGYCLTCGHDLHSGEPGLHDDHAADCPVIVALNYKTLAGAEAD